MFALIMAGGAGSRLGLGEKPLVDVCGRPMIQYVLDAFDAAGYETLVVLTTQTLYTSKWCHAQGIDSFRASVGDYIGDIIEAVEASGLAGPLVTSSCDLPCITPEIITRIRNEYEASGQESCSVWVPFGLCERFGCRQDCTSTIRGELAAPAGINLLSAGRIREEQDEFQIFMDDWRLALNVNTREALSHARRILGSGRSVASGP
jgi:adenosylcobinamide-phosphate guanylyltransferase